jgi:hypothetical protein
VDPLEPLESVVEVEAVFDVSVDPVEPELVFEPVFEVEPVEVEPVEVEPVDDEPVEDEPVLEVEVEPVEPPVLVPLVVVESLLLEPLEPLPVLTVGGRIPMFGVPLIGFTF